MAKCANCGYEITGSLQTICPRCFTSLAPKKEVAHKPREHAAAPPPKTDEIRIVTTSAESIVSAPKVTKEAVEEPHPVLPVEPAIVGLVLSSFPRKQVQRVNAVLRTQAGLSGDEAFLVISRAAGGKAAPVAQGISSRSARAISEALEALGARTAILPMPEFMRLFPQGRASVTGGSATHVEVHKKATSSCAGCAIALLIFALLIFICAVASVAIRPG